MKPLLTLLSASLLGLVMGCSDSTADAGPVAQGDTATAGDSESTDNTGDTDGTDGGAGDNNGGNDMDGDSGSGDVGDDGSGADTGGDDSGGGSDSDGSGDSTPGAISPLAVLHTFRGSDGGQPESTLTDGGDGFFYGTTRGGGAFGFGTLFRVTATGTHTIITHFDGDNGAGPQSAPVLATDGALYGVTTGADDFGTPDGTIYRYTPGGSYEVVSNAIAGPIAGLIQASDNDLYGVSFQGVLYRVTLSGTVTVLGQVPDDADACLSRLLEAGDGMLYGTCALGGVSDRGVLFRATRGGGIEIVAAFNGLNGEAPGANGREPRAGLIQAGDGFLYGTTNLGGTGDDGTLYRLSLADDTITTLVNFAFNEQDASGNDVGRFPHAELVQASDGALYGTTSQGGDSNAGTVFRYLLDGTYQTLYSFAGSVSPDGNDNRQAPEARLIQTADGTFYGTTSLGGLSADGQATPRGSVFSFTIGQ